MVKSSVHFLTCNNPLSFGPLDIPPVVCTVLQQIFHPKNDFFLLPALAALGGRAKLANHPVASFDRTIEHLENRSVTAGGKTLVIRNFFVGDHMVEYKVTGADGPTASAPTREICPFCGAPPNRVESKLNCRFHFRMLHSPPFPTRHEIPKQHCHFS